MIKQDLLNYLNNLRESTHEDETQKWIGSYNARQIILNKFFRWLNNPDKPNQRKRKTKTPNIINGIKQLARKEKHYIKIQIYGSQKNMQY